MSTKGIEMPNELELYPHNEKAYRKLLDMLSETRRASLEKKRDTVSRRVSLNEINHDFDVR